ncbi:MAG: FecR family protein [Ginsengibacter sp.]
MISGNIIERFLAGKCSSNEEKAVLRHFEENSPEDNELYKSGDILLTEKFNLPINRALSAKMLEQIFKAISAKKKLRRRWITTLSAAAALIIVAVGIQFYFSSQNFLPLPKKIAQSRVSTTNTSSLKENVHLTDGTDIILNPGSAISYLPEFEPGKRDIYLEGEALFKVAKDAGRPFTVYTHKVSTTALGTEFRVRSSPDNIFITLYKGKIVVKETNNISENYFLNPGNSINYNILSKHFSLTGESKELTVLSKASKSKVKSNQPATVDLSLNNTSLKNALDQLAEKFNVEIEYSPADIENINIIANVSPSQSIGKILENITQLNGLLLIKISSKKFVIRKTPD